MTGPAPWHLPLEATIPILPTLKTRAEFLAVRGGRRSSTPAFLIEVRERRSEAHPIGGPRFGFTITKKIGNAVTRNRIRRRLKAAFAVKAKEHADPRCDYVIVARPAALDRPYALLLEDTARALSALRNGGGQSRPREPDFASRGKGSRKGSA